MSVAQARTALGRELTTDPEFDDSCRTYIVAGLEGLTLLFEHGRLDSINVGDGGHWKTAMGVGVDDTEAKVRKAYAGKVRASRNAYEDPPAAYLTVRGPHGRGLKFTTDGHRRVRSIDAGGASIANIEGCA